MGAKELVVIEKDLRFMNGLQVKENEASPHWLTFLSNLKIFSIVFSC